jgi:hypothetical protein
LVLYAYLCVFAHSRFIENPPDMILGDKLLIFEVVLSHLAKAGTMAWLAMAQGRCASLASVAKAHAVRALALSAHEWHSTQHDRWWGNDDRPVRRCSQRASPAQGSPIRQCGLAVSSLEWGGDKNAEFTGGSRGRAAMVAMGGGSSGCSCVMSPPLKRMISPNQDHYRVALLK